MGNIVTISVRNTASSDVQLPLVARDYLIRRLGNGLKRGFLRWRHCNIRKDEVDVVSRHKGRWTSRVFPPGEYILGVQDRLALFGATFVAVATTPGFQ